jgi:two-component system chemotaxis response regulator CheB
MFKPDIVVIGASAGGVEVLKQIMAGLPADFSEAVFVVLHIGNGFYGRSLLPEILSTVGPLSAGSASDGEPIRREWIYVAVPNYHMMIGLGYVRLVYGRTRENLTRPATNPLFRSGAEDARRKWQQAKTIRDILSDFSHHKPSARSSTRASPWKWRASSSKRRGSQDDVPG